MRKAVAMLVLGAIAMGGCAPQRERQIVVRMANWGGAQEDNEFERTLTRLYAEFEQETGIDVRIERIPDGYVNKMLLSFVAGTEPDVMALDASSAAVFINNGVLKDLTPLIARDPEFRLDDYWPNVVDIARRGDRLYAIPGDFTPMAVYYNKRMFDAAGVPYPRPGWTWDEFVATAKRLTVPGRQYGLKFANWMPGWVMWIWNNGGDVLSPDGSRSAGHLDGAAALEAFGFLRDLIEVHRVAPSLSSAAAAGVDLFGNGQAAMTISGHWEQIAIANAPKIKTEDVGVVPLPSRRGGPSSTAMYAVGYAISRNSRNPEAAWKLVRFMTSRRFQEAYNSTGIAVSARRDVADARGAQFPLTRAFVDIIPSARAPWGAKVEGYEYVERQGEKMMEAVLAGTPPATAAKETTRRIDRYFRIK